MKTYLKSGAITKNIWKDYISPYDEIMSTTPVTPSSVSDGLVSTRYIQRFKSTTLRRLIIQRSETFLSVFLRVHDDKLLTNEKQRLYQARPSY
jgi:hypothetical protein